MSEQETFEAAIHRDPFNESLRLQYADWLEDRGGEQKASLVRAGEYFTIPNFDRGGSMYKLFVWLDGQPSAVDGEAVVSRTLGAHDVPDLREQLRMIGLRYATEPGRQVKASIWNPVADSWCRPNGDPIEAFAAYSVELDVRVGSERV